MRGLVLTGGGVKGAFQCGVLTELIKRGGDWDYISGNSVGALNASIIGQASSGEMQQRGSELYELWAGVAGNKAIWKHWFMLRQAAGVWKDSMYNSAPLLELLQDSVSPASLRSSGRSVRFGVTGYGSGQYREIDPSTVPEKEVHRWIASSAAFPGFLTPYELDGDIWIDGAIRRGSPLKGAVTAGCTELDIVMTSPLTSKEKDTKDNWSGTRRNAFSMLMRAVELMSDEVLVKDIQLFRRVNDLIAEGHVSVGDKKAVKLRVFYPEDHLLSGSMESLEFKPDKILSMIRIGEQRARDILDEQPDCRG